MVKTSFQLPVPRLLDIPLNGKNQFSTSCSPVVRLNFMFTLGSECRPGRQTQPVPGYAGVEEEHYWRLQGILRQENQYVYLRPETVSSHIQT